MIQRYSGANGTNQNENQAAAACRSRTGRINRQAAAPQRRDREHRCRAREQVETGRRLGYR